jgi:hypothetical protein
VPASPSGKGEACIGDLFNFDFKKCWSGCSFETHLNSIGSSVPQMKHITSALRAQQVNAIYMFATIAY